MEKMDFVVRFQVPGSVGIELVEIDVEADSVSHRIMTEFRDELFKLMDEHGCSYEHTEARC